MPAEIIQTAETILQSQSNSPPKTDFATQIGHLSTAEGPEDYAVDESQVRITPTQRSLCALLVRGFSLAAACRQLHANYAAASRWKQQEWFEPVLEEERQKWFLGQGIDKKQETFAPLVGLALESLREAMKSEDDKVRLAAATLIFEQFFDSKRPVGRPRHMRPEDNTPPDLSDLRVIAEQRVADMNASVRNSNGHVNIVANG